MITKFVPATTVQVPAPSQAPLQPSNTEPSCGFATRLIVVPAGTSREQLAEGQSIPAGTLVTAPVPVPVRVTPIESNGTKLAVTVVSALTARVQVSVPTHRAELQPANELPVSGTAVRVTVVPWVTPAEQVAPQLMPAGLLVTVPVPPPLVVTDNVGWAGGGAPKFAVTC